MEAAGTGPGSTKRGSVGQADGQGLGQSSSLSTKHNLFFGRVPTLAHPATSVSHLQERGVVGKATMKAHMRENMEYCQKRLIANSGLDEFTFPVRKKEPQRNTTVVKYKRRHFKFWTLRVSQK